MKGASAFSCASWTEYNADPHGKYALLVSAAANIDIRVYT